MSTALQDSAEAATPPVETRLLRGLARLALNRLAQRQPDLAARAQGAPDLWLDRTVEAVTANIASGRFAVAQDYATLVERQDQPSQLDYVTQVLAELLAEWDRLAALKAGETTVWAAVIKRLEKIAYHWLGPHGRGTWAAWEAAEAAAQTCADLWQWLQTHRYPFDVLFDRWSVRALQNRLKERTRKRRTYERLVPAALDIAWDSGEDRAAADERLADDQLDRWLEHDANCQALRQAIERLDPRQARVVRLWYLEGWPADEIAADLSTSTGNVYMLRFRGIEKLREIAHHDERLGLAHALNPLKAEAGRVRPAGDRADGHKESSP